MKKSTLLPFLVFTMLCSLTAGAQTNGSEGQAEPNKTRTNSVSGQVQMVNPNRELLIAPDWSAVKVDQPYKVSMMLEVDNNGHVLSANPIAAKTTTTDPILLGQLSDMIIQDARYVSKGSVAKEKVLYSFSLSPQ